MTPRPLAALLLLLAATTPALAQTTRASGARVEIRSLLVRDARSATAVPGLPVVIDPVVAAIADGTWSPPVAGDGWSPLESGPDGGFQDRRISGGYAYAEVVSDVPRVMLLRAAGHAMLYVNGSPRAGDVYSHGYLALPVQLTAGKNTLLFAGGRGQLRATLEPAPDAPFVLQDDSMLPDLLRDANAPLLASVVVVNPTAHPLDVLPSAHLTNQPPTPQEPTTLPPMSVRRARISLPSPASPLGEKTDLIVSLGGTQSAFPLRWRTSAQSRRVTFTSDIDGSVQYYALVPAQNTSITPAPALVLSLHGASVEATSQADAYAPKSWAHIVCPTNRRPFGFDWEDWGRLDALEVLAHARKTLPNDPSRTHLTGHSMGGHGTWHLAANHPGLFAAAAPSAGWIAFSTYSPARAATQPATTPTTSVTTVATTSPADTARAHFRAASLPSDTFALLPNLATTGLFILHGDADDNVPVREARTMAALLKPFHNDFSLLEQPGAGHWWDDNETEPGASCVDHPRIFDLFARRRLPQPGELRQIAFYTANPAVHSRYEFAEIAQQLTPGQISSVDLRYDPVSNRITGTTSNVATLILHSEGASASVTLDGQNPSPATTVRRIDGKWISAELPPAEKNPRRAGPLKLALQNRMLFVYPTRGTPEENAAAYDLARYHAETWHYRAAGSVDLVPDTHPLLTTDPDRTLVLYGNADTNAAWPANLLRSPLSVSRAAVQIGDQTLTGDLTAFFCRPRPGSDNAMIVALASTSPRAARAHTRVPLFTSGIAFPDYAIFSADSPATGASAVLGSGFFTNIWQLP